MKARILGGGGAGVLLLAGGIWWLSPSWTDGAAKKGATGADGSRSTPTVGSRPSDPPAPVAPAARATRGRTAVDRAPETRVRGPRTSLFNEPPRGGPFERALVSPSMVAMSGGNLERLRDATARSEDRATRAGRLDGRLAARLAALRTDPAADREVIATLERNLARRRTLEKRTAPSPSARRTRWAD
ncbi:MAG: hypothetical protein JW751_18350 [Polyangiaceae bacterium]|nr:hypothetical protein [Polyangiaceae bacterium]